MCIRDREYTVLDKAHRIKLTDEMLEAAGIESNKVRVDVQDRCV